MARRIDDEMIIKINTVYLECGVKSKTAKICGVSPSTVSKYIIEGFQVPTAEPEVPVEFNKPIPGAAELIERIKNSKESSTATFCKVCMLTDDEWEAMEQIQKRVSI